MHITIHTSEKELDMLGMTEEQLRNVVLERVDSSSFDEEKVFHRTEVSVQVKYGKAK